MIRSVYYAAVKKAMTCNDEKTLCEAMCSKYRKDGHSAVGLTHIMNMVCDGNNRLLRHLLYRPILHGVANRMPSDFLNKKIRVRLWTIPVAEKTQETVDTNLAAENLEEMISNHQPSFTRALRRKLISDICGEGLRTSPLHVAAILLDIDTAKDLLRIGADPVFRDSRGRTVFEFLLETKALMEKSFGIHTRAPYRTEDAPKMTRSEEECFQIMDGSGYGSICQMVNLLLDFVQQKDLHNIYLKAISSSELFESVQRVSTEMDAEEQVMGEYHQIKGQDVRPLNTTPDVLLGGESIGNSNLFHHIRAPETTFIPNRGYVPKDDSNFKGRIYNKRRDARATPNINLPNWYSPKG